MIDERTDCHSEPAPLDTHGLTLENLLEIDYFLRLTRTLEERLVAPPLEAAALPDKARVLAAARELLRY